MFISSSGHTQILSRSRGEKWLRDKIWFGAWGRGYCLSCFGGIWCITLTNKNIILLEYLFWIHVYKAEKQQSTALLSTALLSAAFLSQLPLLRPLDLPLTSWFRNCNWTLNFRLCTWGGECSITKNAPILQSYFNSKQVTSAFIWFADLCSYFVCKYSIATIFI